MKKEDNYFTMSALSLLDGSERIFRGPEIMEIRIIEDIFETLKFYHEISSPEEFSILFGKMARD